jgi:hypothetical protein
VWIKGRTYWLGKWGSPEAQLAYNRLIAEYLATGRIENVRPDSASQPVTEVVASPARPTVTRQTPPVEEGRTSDALTVIELVSLYLEYCQTYYRDPSGQQTSTYGNALQASRALRPFDDTLASSFVTPSPNLEPGLLRESSCPRWGWKGFSDEEATQCRADRGLASAG